MCLSDIRLNIILTHTCLVFHSIRDETDNRESVQVKRGKGVK